MVSSGKTFMHTSSVESAGELSLLFSGVDAGIMDPLGRQAVTSPGFASITDKLMAAAEKLCDGKLVFCHEGGYSATYSPVCVHTIIERLSQTKALEKDPYFYIFEHMHGSVGQAMSQSSI